jgi:hypothetical protein
VYNTCMSKTSKHPQFTAYIPKRVLDALKKEAEKQHRSMNGQLVWCLEQCLGLEKDEGTDATGREASDQEN